MGRICGTYEKKINIYRILVGKSEVKRPPGISKRR